MYFRCQWSTQNNTRKLNYKTLTTTPSQFVLTNHVRRPSIRIYKGLKSDQHLQIITKLALN